MPEIFIGHIPPTPAAPRPRRNPLLFLAATVLFIVFFEIIARHYVFLAGNFWYSVRDSSQHHPVNVIFMGSSRTAASINPKYLQELLSTPDYPVYVENAGTGYTTPVEFYLAFRNSLNENPDAFKNCTLVIEAPGQIPHTQTWHEPWALVQLPEFLIPHLRIQDLPRAWQAEQTFEDRLQITCDWLFHDSILYADRHNLGAACYHGFEWPVKNTLDPPVKAPDVDLTSTGGIRIDPNGIALSRKVAYTYVDTCIAIEHPIDWNDLVMTDLVTLAHAHHVNVVFFAPPLHSLFQTIYNTPVRKKDREAFVSVSAQWNTPLLVPTIPLVDEDFPDLWHLRHSRTNEFTYALFQEWKKHVPAR